MTYTRPGYIYVMRNNEECTINHLKGIGARIINKCFWHKRYPRNGQWYWGWVMFDRPIHLYDAMMAGLVPIYKERVKDADKHTTQAESHDKGHDVRQVYQRA